MGLRGAIPANESMVGPYAECVRHENATPLTYKGTNTWILAAPGDERCLVVDPGPANEACVDRIAAACRKRNLTVAAIVLTHRHPDHAGCATAASQVLGAPILCARATGRDLDPEVICAVDGTLEEGPLAVDGVSLAIEVVALPGHSSDSVGLYVPDGDFVVTGDVIFAQSSTMVCWPDGRLADYMDSLDKLAHLVDACGVSRLLTAHGPVVENPGERIEQARRHRTQRLNQVVAAVRSGIPAHAEPLVEAIYNDVPANLHDGAVRSVNAQLRYAFDKGMLQENK